MVRKEGGTTASFPNFYSFTSSFYRDKGEACYCLYLITLRVRGSSSLRRKVVRIKNYQIFTGVYRNFAKVAKFFSHKVTLCLRVSILPTAYTLIVSLIYIRRKTCYYVGKISNQSTNIEIYLV